MEVKTENFQLFRQKIAKLCIDDSFPTNYNAKYHSKNVVQ